MKPLREIALPGLFDVATNINLPPVKGQEPVAPDVPMSSETFTGRVADYFKARPNQWIDGRELAKVGGAYAWRSRVSDCRKPPYSLTIENRVRRVDIGGESYSVSEYRWVP